MPVEPGRGGARVMVIFSEHHVGPAGGSAQGFILNDGRVGQKLLLPAFIFEAVVGAGPDAFEIVDFALAFAGATTGAIALVFGALRFGAEEGDVGEGAIAAVFAGEEGAFGGVFEDAEDARALLGVLGALV